MFESDTIRNLLGHYCNLLEGIVENPDRRISRYSLLTQNQRRDVTNQSRPIAPNHRFVQFRKPDIEQSLCSRFEQQARLFPTKLALTTQEHQWSYAELIRQANRIAHTLVKHCGQGGERIAMLFDHGAPMVAALLLLFALFTTCIFAGGAVVRRHSWKIGLGTGIVACCNARTVSIE